MRDTGSVRSSLSNVITLAMSLEARKVLRCSSGSFLHVAGTYLRYVQIYSSEVYFQIS